MTQDVNTSVPMLRGVAEKIDELENHGYQVRTVNLRLNTHRSKGDLALLADHVELAETLTRNAVVYSTGRLANIRQWTAS